MDFNTSNITSRDDERAQATVTVPVLRTGDVLDAVQRAHSLAYHDGIEFDYELTGTEVLTDGDRALFVFTYAGSEAAIKKIIDATAHLIVH